MEKKEKRLDVIKTMIREEKILLFADIEKQLLCPAVTLRRDLKAIKSMTSFTHRGKYVTLKDIPTFNKHGIWFFRGVGFARFNTSLELIVSVVENSKNGINQDEIESIMKIGISKQIQILMEQERLHRIKIGAKYVYLPSAAARDKKKKLKLVGSRQIEERFEQGIKVSDLIAGDLHFPYMIRDADRTIRQDIRLKTNFLLFNRSTHQGEIKAPIPPHFLPKTQFNLKHVYFSPVSNSYFRAH